MSNHKTCTKCLLTKQLIEFPTPFKNKDKLAKYCNPCYKYKKELNEITNAGFKLSHVNKCTNEKGDLDLTRIIERKKKKLLKKNNDNLTKTRKKERKKGIMKQKNNNNNNNNKENNNNSSNKENNNNN
eukprot:Pgem_evm1s9320